MIIVAFTCHEEITNTISNCGHSDSLRVFGISEKLLFLCLMKLYLLYLNKNIEKEALKCEIIKAKKKNLVFPLTCTKKLGWVGRQNFYFFKNI